MNGIPRARVVCDKCSSSSGATKGIAEPDENERFNIGMLKALTGNDKIQARPLYRDRVQAAKAIDRAYEWTNE